MFTLNALAMDRPVACVHMEDERGAVSSRLLTMKVSPVLKVCPMNTPYAVLFFKCLGYFYFYDPFNHYTYFFSEYYQIYNRRSLHLFNTYKISNGENLRKCFWFSWPNYGRRGAHAHLNGSYHSGVCNSKRVDVIT